VGVLGLFSGEEQYIEEEKMPIESFPEQQEENPIIHQKQCTVTGCSSQLCLDAEQASEIDSTCEWKEEYGCYREAVCELQENGMCGWTETTELLSCVDTMRNPQTPPVFEEEETSLKEDEEMLIQNEEQKQEKEIPSTKKVSDLISWGFTPSSGRDIDTVIIHSSFNALEGDEYDTDAIIAIYKEYGVGAHYIIERGGKVRKLIEEKNIAYHAGVSELPDGRTKVNEVSIGIEMVGNYDDGFTKEQYASLESLLDEINSRYDITYILGHDEIAPGRKTDPWNFDWKKIDR